ncbi:bifunctional glutamate--cysteine ligase GshA/glutathione synthetase GshB [Leptospira borgpetersenii]|uniref:bifunctional glutamate--cysteine ligase GshA/glutathione synthetase GshB n=1 Tax=Leptospira borgpetersenii TaxID=174 RepID=UPI000773A5F7|nr:bifunctional glutamate--cysteine ligase GshA/glutathione synthetase GshB [Leptospira borgpetersenii]MBE8362553.1 bifunctional glutamate--cysteine ligase GshA/glutathione synthetase GshB [Leptospira borgpetersenii serovar Balcanica]MBE8368796.1 bifunctional glutamate--cysteine ligase GshA/glutathione synthetase GshB [Leptospira borgpetersenii serovar Balcanica]MBE8400701.1 bifunctional glutamate--cysteine ligase GshA/glutathione synthetase GshB [Leptospira borgpetersenii serovar Tarassovi]MBE
MQSLKLKPGEFFSPEIFTLKGFEDLEISTQIVIRDALNRGLEVEVLDRKNHFLRLRNSNGFVQYVKEASKTALDSYMSFLVMENKTISKIVMHESGLLVPEGDSFGDPESALIFWRKNSNRKIVVKPVTTNFGIGITILVPNASEEDAKKAIKIAFNHSESVIVEEFAEGNEYRFLVIGAETIAVCNRVPANVTGDGIHTIEELVALKNEDKRRGVGHVTPLEKIQLGDTELDVLQQSGFTKDSIPSKDQKVFLRKNSNISTGGDSIDVTDLAHPFYKKLAVKAAQLVGAKICGVDIILKDLEKQEDYRILELNFNPVLYIHNYPYEGKNRDVGNKILDLLGF